MFDRPLIAFDIECIPDPEIGRVTWNLIGDDASVVRAMVERRLEETSGSNRYPALPWHRIVCICATLLGPKSGEVEMRVLGGEEANERESLEGFFQLFARQRSPRLVSWNGGGYDLPVIRYRAMRHGIRAPELYRHDDEFRYNNYQNRYHNMHVDLMDVLSGYGASTRAGLGPTSVMLGLPGKVVLDGEVYEHWLAGERSRVIEYCKLDTLQTLLVYLAWSYHNGSLEAADLARYVASVREVIAAQTHPVWPEIATALASWPAWR